MDVVAAAGGDDGAGRPPPPIGRPPPPIDRRRRRWWHWLAAFGVAVVVAVGAVVVLTAILLALAVSHGGDGVSNGLSVTNRTRDDLTVVSLVGGTDSPAGPIIDRSQTEVIGTVARDGTTLMTDPTPTEGGCTVAPLVARRADGSEAGRREAGACVFQVLVDWEVG